MERAGAEGRDTSIQSTDRDLGLVFGGHARGALQLHVRGAPYSTRGALERPHGRAPKNAVTKPARAAFRERETPGAGSRATLAKERTISMHKLWHHFQEGGWAMYPVFALGLIAVGAAARFALRGEHQLLAFIRWTLASLLATGAFGFTVGSMMLLNAAQKPAEPMLAARIIMEGITEAANNILAALMFTIFACMCVAVGQRRFPQPNPSAIPR